MLQRISVALDASETMRCGGEFSVMLEPSVDFSVIGNEVVSPSTAEFGASSSFELRHAVSSVAQSKKARSMRVIVVPSASEETTGSSTPEGRRAAGPFLEGSAYARGLATWLILPEKGLQLRDSAGL
jgi:hypothetical protein